MVYKKITLVAIMLAIIAAVVSSFTFGATDTLTNDKIIDSTLQY